MKPCEKLFNLIKLRNYFWSCSEKSDGFPEGIYTLDEYNEATYKQTVTFTLLKTEVRYIARLLAIIVEEEEKDEVLRNRSN